MATLFSLMFVVIVIMRLVGHIRAALAQPEPQATAAMVAGQGRNRSQRLVDHNPQLGSQQLDRPLRAAPAPLPSVEQLLPRWHHPA